MAENNHKCVRKLRKELGEHVNEASAPSQRLGENVKNAVEKLTGKKWGTNEPLG